MEAKMLLVVLILQMSLVALGGAAERCAQPGALRCEEGRHQSVCLERSRVWHRLSDCAASGGVCAHGRCVGGVEQRDAGENCEYPAEPRCSADCTGIDVCQTNNLIATIDCGSGKLCDDTGDAQCVAASQAKCGQAFECTFSGNVPDLNNPRAYYRCTSSEGNAAKILCKEGEGLFNACSGSCDPKLEVGPTYDQCATTGESFPLSNNPSLYFICIGTKAYWNKCAEGYYDIQIRKCTGSSIHCADCKGNTYSNI